MFEEIIRYALVLLLVGTFIYYALTDGGNE